MTTRTKKPRALSLLIAFALVATLLLPAIGSAGFVSPAVVVSADAYESNDTSATASVVPEVSWHSFHDDGDEDWFKVTVTATDTPILAELQIWDGKSGADSQIAVYEADGTTKVFGNDDHNNDYYFPTYSSAAYYVAPSPGTYFVKCYQNGDETRFDYRLMLRTGLGVRPASGATRYETAVALNRFIASDAHIYSYESEWQYLAIASGQSYADALVAGYFAGMVTDEDEPCGVLYTHSDTLTSATEAEISRYFSQTWFDDSWTKVYIIGGSAVVSDAVMNAIADLPYVDEVERLSGDNRYDTAVAANRELEDEFSVDNDLYLVSGTSWADSLVGGAVAVDDTDMFLLAPPGGMTPAMQSFLEYMDLDDACVVGGPAAVSGTVYNQVLALAGDEVERVYGDTRYSTARELHEWYGSTGDSMVLVSGESWPDGVMSAALAGEWMDGAPIFLTPRNTLAWDVKKWIDDNGPSSKPSYLIGGPGAVSDAVYNEWSNYY